MIVENEWGWVEEITLTYVVVRIWDLRRLILPITYFIERPFQNWTRKASIFYGTVLGLFVVAFFIRRVTATPVFVGALIAQAVVVALFFTSSLGFLWSTWSAAGWWCRSLRSWWCRWRSSSPRQACATC